MPQLQEDSKESTEREQRGIAQNWLALLFALLSALLFAFWVSGGGGFHLKSQRYSFMHNIDSYQNFKSCPSL